MKITRANYLSIGVAILAASISLFGQPSDIRPAANAAAHRATDGRPDLNAPFDIEAKANIGTDGKIDPASISYTRSDGDPAMLELVKGYVPKINDSPYIQHLASLGVSEIVIRAKQDDSQFAGAAVFELPNALRAMAVRSMLSAMLPMLRKQKEREEMSEADKRDLALLNAASVGGSGRSVTVALNMPKAEFRDIVEKELKK